MLYDREVPRKRPVAARTRDYREFLVPLAEKKIRDQGARCMDCGIPFCHSGCPLGNIIPDWNDLVYRGRWAEALDRLLATNNFPEFTGRICPAPCEEACTLGINEQPVTIEYLEKAIIERGFQMGLIKPEPPLRRTTKKVAVVGSGPSGLACAYQLNRAGHWVTVFERHDRPGGLLRYGIPDFKLEKSVLDRRLKLMEAEGIKFKVRCNVGEKPTVDELRREFDAVVLAGGATKPRDIGGPGRELEGVVFAMDFLAQQNRRVAGLEVRNEVLATGKNVIVIGGGDTGSDCVGTCNRQGAKSITNFELFPRPSESRPANQPWPFWPMKLRTSTSHQEGCHREWSIQTKAFLGEGGKLTGLQTVQLQFVAGPDGRTKMSEVPGSEKVWPCELVLLAMGFVGPDPEGIVAKLGVKLDPRGNVACGEDYQTSVPGVFSAGDMRRGQSLVVWAISEGRECAHCVDAFLVGKSLLPRKGDGDLPRV
jgi:glutamate synthase (NADPH/NADH) small chain